MMAVGFTNLSLEAIALVGAAKPTFRNGHHYLHRGSGTLGVEAVVDSEWV